MLTRILYRVLAIALFASLVPVTLHADSMMVKMLEGVDSSQGKEGQQYAALVAKDANISGVLVPKDTQAVVLLTKGVGNSEWTLQLAAIILNGKIMLVRGNSPAVIPMGAADLLTMRKRTVSTPTRIAVGAGLTVRFSVPGPLTPAPPNTTMQPVPAGSAPSTAAPAPGAVSAVAAAVSPTPPALPGPRMDPSTKFGEPDAVFDQIEFEVKLKGCAKQTTASVTCDFTVTNKGPDRVVGVNSGFGVVDEKGQVVPPTAFEFAGGSRNWTQTVSGVTAKAHATYNGVDPDVNVLARVPFQLATGPGDANEPHGAFTVEFHNVRLGGGSAPAKMQTAALDSGMVSELAGWRFTLAGCYTAAPRDKDRQVVECYTKIENLKADDGIDLNGGSLTDSEGNEVGANWYKHTVSGGADECSGWVGGASDFAHVHLLQPDHVGCPFPNSMCWDQLVSKPKPNAVQNANPQYVYVVFSDVGAGITKLAQLRVMFNMDNREGPGRGPVQATFRNVPILKPPASMLLKPDPPRR
jgi:hypothetical protein